MRVESIGIIIQARSNSSRLPNKILLPFWKKTSLLELVIQTCKDNSYLLPIVVATSGAIPDNEIAHAAERCGVSHFRGSEQDVLSRFIECAEEFKFKQIIRVCADNPFLSVLYLNLLIDYENDSYDYVSYANHEGVPAIKTHLGLFCEKVKLTALKKAQSLTTEAFYHEHVTNFIYTNNDLFKVHFLQMPNEVYKRTDLRLTCDTQEDFNMLKLLFQEYKQSCDIDEKLKCLIEMIDRNFYYRDTMSKGINRFIK